MNNQPDRPSLPVTDLSPRPGDFPVGSPASRAAARALLRRKEGDDDVLLTVQFSVIGSPWVHKSLHMASGRIRSRIGRKVRQNPDGSLEIDWDAPLPKPDEYDQWLNILRLEGSIPLSDEE